ncbi:MAG: P22 coat protein [Abditibacteriota bacterium]|nr:P22 coat protein [Abditibacteriota bacterium]
MANTFLTPSIIAKEAVMILENNLIAGSLAYKNFSSEFSKVGDTITVRKPATFVANDFSSSISVQNATETGITLKLDKFKDVSFAVTTKDLSLTLNQFSEQLLQPAMRALHQQIDSDVLSVANEFPYFYTRGASASIGDFAQMGKILNNNKAPMDNRYCVMSADHYADYISLDGIYNAEKSGTTDGLRRASLGRVMDFETYMDQNIPDLPENTTTTGNATGTAGNDYITVATSSDVPIGSMFTIAGDTTIYTVTGKDTTNKKINIYPLLQADASSAALTFKTGKKSSLFFHKNAIALVSAPLEVLSANRTASESWNGITIRVTMDYDINTKKDIISVDCLYGVKVIDTALGARLVSA